MKRTLMVYGLLLPAAALVLFMTIVPGAVTITRWEERYWRTSEAVREPMIAFVTAADTARAREDAVVRIDSRERARSVASHRRGLLFATDSGVSDQARESVRRIVLEELAEVISGEPRHPIAVITMVDARALYPPFLLGVVLPETPEAPCVVVVRIAKRYANLSVVRGTDRLLGTCAFYGAFGAPGDGMHGWLLATGMRAAGYLRRPLSHGDGVIRDPAEANAAAASGPDMAACRAGRLDGCERLFTEPVSARTFINFDAITRPPTELGPATRGVSITRPQEFNAARTGVAAGLLGLMAESLGAEHFGTLWASHEPPLRAFEQVAGRTLATWVSEQVDLKVKVYRAGPALSMAQWTSLLVLLAVAGVAGVRLSPGKLT